MSYTPEDYKRFAEVPFEKVLKYLRISVTPNATHLNGEIAGKPFNVNIEKNLFWVDDNDHGNVISFLAMVRGCKNSVAAQEIENQFFTTDGKQLRNNAEAVNDFSQEIIQPKIITLKHGETIV
ncbi:MAG: hypothetical protein WCU00_02670, partial [Candidatus Latescibacterota bacterium]